MLGYLSKFLYVLGERSRQLVLLILLFIFTSLLETVGIGLVGPFIAMATNRDLDRFIQQNDRLSWVSHHLGLTSGIQFISLLGLLVVIIFYIKSFLSFSIQRYVFTFGCTQRGELCVRLLKAYTSAPYTYHLVQNSAALMQNMVLETDQFCYRVLMPFLFAVSNSVVIIAIVALLIKTNIMAVAIIGGAMLLAFALFSQFKHKIANWGKEQSESYEEMMRIINHSMGGLKEIRVIGCAPYFEEQAVKQMNRNAVSGSSFMAFSNLPRYAVEAFLITFLVGFTLIFLNLHPEQASDLNSVLGVFALASIRLLPALGNVIASANDVRYASYSLDRLYVDLKTLDQVQAEDQARWQLSQSNRGGPPSPMLHFNQQLSLDRVTYQYPSADKNSLTEVSLTIRRGESIGLIGRSGAGKTTLVDVILGLLVPSSGDIKTDGMSIYQNLRAWQNLIGYVPQSIFLTDDTLTRNIAFGVPDHLIDPEKLAHAIHTAQLTELVQQLPDGAETVIGERGVRLSGGQRQRIGIARVIYHDREILILDEATAALDNETESLVSEAVKALGNSKTLIIIAHRLTTVEHCDRIYALEKGQIVKMGSYQEVVLSASAWPESR
jgi:ATP-binding cassette, subfamily B, bacterial PglK